MQTLNLPQAPLKILHKGTHAQVFDPLRRRYVRLTPEEWVRQHFVHFLIACKGFPAPRMANEMSIQLHATTKRCDTVCFDSQARPLVIVEYKAPTITLSQHTLSQISRYNMVLRVPYLILSNGLQHLCIHVNYENGEYRFLNDIPHWNEL